MVRQKNWIDDKHWLEVEKINSYAIFMGYLLLSVRGLGLLMLTWTTVVLLGGFVTMLHKKDFWCLTAITLVQTAGVFDFLLEEKASDIGSSLKGLLAAVAAVVIRPFEKDTKTYVDSPENNREDKEPSTAPFVLVDVLSGVQALVLAIVLCPLAVLYLLGLYVSAGISLWRLIQHDYGNTGEGANLKPAALNILYSLAISQGVVYGYRTIYYRVARTGLAEEVANHYSLEEALVSEYLEETVAGCMKDPSFARGRNLVTYAVDLVMESKSSYGYISGVLILGKVILKKVPYGHSSLMKQLLSGSASFSHMVHRLLDTFGPESPYSTEIRVRAARIVATVAGSVCLDRFPDQGVMMIQCTSSLLDTAEEYCRPTDGFNVGQRSFLPKEYERVWLLDKQEVRYLLWVDRIPTPIGKAEGYKSLVVQGLCILQGLAANKENCRVISNNQDLLHKIMSPLISERLHGSYHHDEWCNMAEESLEVLKRLMAATPPGEAETQLTNEISGNIQSIIRAVQVILQCLRCHVLLKRQAVEVLLDLSVDTHIPASIMLMPGGSGSSSTMLVWILLHISVVPDCHVDRMCGSAQLAKKSSDIKRLAGEKLQAMLSSHASTLRSIGDIIRNLATAVADAENNTGIRVHAAKILGHLVRYYTKDDENLNELKKAMTDVMPEVLKEIIVRVWRTREAGIQAVPEAGTDLEQGGSSLDKNGQESNFTPQQTAERYLGIQPQKAFLQMCWKLCLEWYSQDRALNRQLNEMAAKICSGQRMPDKTFIQGMPGKTFITLVSEGRVKVFHEEEKASRLAAVRTSE